MVVLFSTLRQNVCIFLAQMETNNINNHQKTNNENRNNNHDIAVAYHYLLNILETKTCQKDAITAAEVDHIIVVITGRHNIMYRLSSSSTTSQTAATTTTTTTSHHTTLYSWNDRSRLYVFSILTMLVVNTARFANRLAPPAAMAGFALYASIQDAHAKEASKTDLNQVRQAIMDVVETDAEKRGDGTSLAGTFIRLAWHCCGTYKASDDSGGSNGARMRFHPEADYGNNAGLDKARAALEPVKAKFPDLSYADLYTYAGVVCVEESGGPKIPFKTGRVDFEDGSTSDKEDRLPNANYGGRDKNVAGMRAVFNRMGFDDQEIVALLGAHAMGRCHTDASGFWGPWTNAETTFSNEYFRLLLEERWSPKMTHNGKPWTGPDQFEDSTGKLMMLPVDLTLVAEPAFRKWVEIYAKDEDKFFKDFAAAFAKLLALGVPNAIVKPWYQFW
ncbi:hem peroxidase [Nitzschia inconspicua]|uniref:Hem peroxidase n=1 Tax=Nitzschia inconspicua TaxID=303405 RepID=A0A9K3LJZ8_9STRA|nr:hem peroxidase [Nitzschia inconspicua]